MPADVPADASFSAPRQRPDSAPASLAAMPEMPSKRPPLEADEKGGEDLREEQKSLKSTDGLDSGWAMDTQSDFAEMSVNNWTTSLYGDYVSQRTAFAASMAGEIARTGQRKSRMIAVSFLPSPGPAGSRLFLAQRSVCPVAAAAREAARAQAALAGRGPGNRPQPAADRAPDGRERRPADRDPDRIVRRPLGHAHRPLADHGPGLSPGLADRFRQATARRRPALLGRRQGARKPRRGRCSWGACGHPSRPTSASRRWILAPAPRRRWTCPTPAIRSN